ncbi:MAG: hypothetical protein WKG07_04450 [Hymenobacter sp.]
MLTTAIRHEANYRLFPKSFLIHAREWDESATPGSDAHTFCPRHPKTLIEKSLRGWPRHVHLPEVPARAGLILKLF